MRNFFSFLKRSWLVILLAAVIVVVIVDTVKDGKKDKKIAARAAFVADSITKAKKVEITDLKDKLADEITSSGDQSRRAEALTDSLSGVRDSITLLIKQKDSLLKACEKNRLEPKPLKRSSANVPDGLKEKVKTGKPR